MKRTETGVTIPHAKGAYYEPSHKYWELGFNIALTGAPKEGKPNPKRPLGKWKHLTTTRQTKEELESLPFEGKRYQTNGTWENYPPLGMGGFSGVNDIRNIDIDGVTDKGALYAILSGLGLELNYKWIVKTGGGYHIWIKSKGTPFEKIKKIDSTNKVFDFQAKEGMGCAHVELRWEHFVVLPPTIHQNGNPYHFLNGEDTPSEPPQWVELKNIETTLRGLTANFPLFDTPTQLIPRPINTPTPTEIKKGNIPSHETLNGLVNDLFTVSELHRYARENYIDGNTISKEGKETRYGKSGEGYGTILVDNNSPRWNHPQNSFAGGGWVELVAMCGLNNFQSGGYVSSQFRQVLKLAASFLGISEEQQKELLSHEQKEWVKGRNTNKISLPTPTNGHNGINTSKTELTPANGRESGLNEVGEPFPFVDWVEVKGKEVPKIGLGNFIDYLHTHHHFHKLRERERESIVRVEDNVMSEFERSQVKTYISSILKPFPVVFNAVRKYSNLFSSDSLEWLGYANQRPHNAPKDKAYLYFQNGFLEITKEGRTLHPYSKLKWLIWESDIIPHNYEHSEWENLDFYDFLGKVSGEDSKRLESLLSAIGYLCHTYKDSSNAKAIFLVDEHSRPNEHNGRTGKSLIKMAISKVLPTWTEDGKSYTQANNRFMFQNVHSKHKLYALEDIKQGFAFEYFYNAITGEMVVEQKGKQPFQIPFEDSPKFLITTNYLPQGMEGDSLKDRQFIIPLSNYFNANNKPVDEYGKRFFDDYSQKEWNQFYSLMVHSIQLFLSGGLVEVDKTETLKKSEFISSTCGEFEEWLSPYKDGNGKEAKRIELGRLYDRRKLFIEFVEAYDMQRLTLRTFGKWLKKYSEYMGNDLNETPFHNRKEMYVELLPF